MYLSRRSVFAGFATAALAIAIFAMALTARAGEKPAVGVIQDGKPLGLFFMTRYWASTHSLEKAGWYFSADGRVYQNLGTGLSPEDLKAHKGPRGTFQVADDALEVTWSDGKKSKSKLELGKNNSFAWDAGLFSPAEPIRDKESIAGNYAGGESLSHRDDKIIVSKTLHLGADGTYQMEGVAVLDGGDLSGSSEGKSQGTWEAAGYSLTLKPTGKETLRLLTFPVDEDFLYVGGMVFKRQKAGPAAPAADKDKGDKDKGDHADKDKGDQKDGDKKDNHKGKDLPGRHLEDMDFVGADFKDAVLKGSWLDRSDATGANFQGADLTNTSFVSCKLANADFRSATFGGLAHFRQADLTNANLQGVDLNGSSFYEATLKGANLKNVKRVGSLTRANLADADLRGANLFTASSLDSARLRNAKYDSHTRWPTGFDPEAAGAKLVKEEDKDDKK